MVSTKALQPTSHIRNCGHSAKRKFDRIQEIKY